MPNDIELGMRLTVDGKGFVGGVKVSGDALDRFAGRAQRVDAATRRMARTTGLAETTVRRTGQSVPPHTPGSTSGPGSRPTGGAGQAPARRPSVRRRSGWGVSGGAHLALPPSRRRKRMRDSRLRHAGPDPSRRTAVKPRSPRIIARPRMRSAAGHQSLSRPGVSWLTARHMPLGPGPAWTRTPPHTHRAS